MATTRKRIVPTEPHRVDDELPGAVASAAATMINLQARRLRVRDDGTGHGRDAVAPFDEFADADAIVVLGDPGMGKTTLFRNAGGQNYRTVRAFLIDPKLSESSPLFLDALDEHRIVAQGVDASAELAKALCAIGKPKFRLACRAADWFGSPDHDALRVASSSGRVVVLELQTLSRDEITSAVADSLPSPEAFLAEAEAAGLGGILGNPQTLELFVSAWASGSKPRSKFEAFELGISQLIKETNQAHGRRAVPLSPASLHDAAAAIASVLLLSGSIGIARNEATEGSGHFAAATVPFSTDAVVAALERRLFVSVTADRFEFVHRTVAEYLAAAHLSAEVKKGLPIERVMALMCGVDGRPVSSLRGLFAWLITHLGSLGLEHVKRDPYAVATYGDASVLPPTVQRQIWISLRDLRDPWFLVSEDDRGSFRSLANRNTAATLLDILQDPAAATHLKIAALEALANSGDPIPEAAAIARNFALNKSNGSWLRSVAVRAFKACVAGDPLLLESLDGELAILVGDAAAPEIRGTLLRCSERSAAFPQKMISILSQAAASDDEDRVIGRFIRSYPCHPTPT